MLSKTLIINDIKPYLHQQFMCEIARYELKHYVSILVMLQHQINFKQYVHALKNTSRNFKIRIISLQSLILSINLLLRQGTVSFI